jgi:hypothetical protein
VLALGLAELDGLGLIVRGAVVLAGSVRCFAGIPVILAPRVCVFGIVHRAFHYPIAGHSVISEQLHHCTSRWVQTHGFVHHHKPADLHNLG